MSRLKNIPIACVEVISNYYRLKTTHLLSLTELISKEPSELEATLKELITKVPEERRSALTYLLDIYRKISPDIENITYSYSKMIEERLYQSLFELSLNLKTLLGTSAYVNITYDDYVEAKIKGLQHSWSFKNAWSPKSEALSDLGKTITEYFIRPLKINLDTEDKIAESLESIFRESQARVPKTHSGMQTEKLLELICEQEKTSKNQAETIHILNNKRSYMSSPGPRIFGYKNLNCVSAATQTVTTDPITDIKP